MSVKQRSWNLALAAAALAVLGVATALASDGIRLSSVGADHVGQHREEHTQLAQRAELVRRELEELGDRHREERRVLENALHETESRAHDVARRVRDVERDAAQSRLRTLQREVERLADVGRHDEAERLAQKVRQLARGLGRETRGQERAHGPERMEFERRAEHLRIAIENLRAAGLHDQAEHLERAAERLLQPEPVSQERHAQQERPHAPALEEAVDRLHAQVAEMREAMHGLQEQIEQLSEQRHREER